MAGTPPYPGDWATKFKALEAKVQAAFTAAQSRVKFAKILAAALIVGADGGRRIVINPEDLGANVSIRFYPEGVAEDYAEILGRPDPDSPGFTRLVINTPMTALSGQIRVDKDNLRMATYDATNTSDGGMIDITRTFVDVGFPYTAITAFTQYTPDGRVNIVAELGVTLPARASNPVVPGTALLYTVGNSLRWLDAAGTVHVIV